MPQNKSIYLKEVFLSLALIFTFVING